MKIALTGKGGVGKSTLAAMIARVVRDQDNKVVVIDADPDMNLATLFDISPQASITPIIEMKELIAERTGTEVGQPAPFFTMNPKVDDIPESYWVDQNGIKLLVMGTVQRGGGGCACPENAFLKSLLGHMMIARKEWVILDMEAGIEHLGRGTALGVDYMLVVVEPNRTSAETAHRIQKLAADIGIKQVKVVGNKVRSASDEDLIRNACDGLEILGFLPLSEQIRQISTGEVALERIDVQTLDPVRELVGRLD
ncbi:MAG: AAA family ATPase [Spirochaetaceae bacterium]|nr:MAG: AAA family ATPase [Spirochaetaceae bacterium]